MADALRFFEGSSCWPPRPLELSCCAGLLGEVGVGFEVLSDMGADGA